MKWLAVILAMLCTSVSTPIWAGDSGLYMDSERYGEGITLIRSGDTVQFFLFTYDPNEGCWNVDPPSIFDGELVDCHEQRYYLNGGDPLIGDTVTGFLYMTLGINYPDGIPSDLDPFVSLVGQDFVMGLYILKRQGDGWRLVVFPVGNALDPEEAIYNTTYGFNRMFLNTDEPEINPND